MQNRFKILSTLVLIVFISLTSCQNKQDALPILGHKSIEGKDTTYHQIADFTFVNIGFLLFMAWAFNIQVVQFLAIDQGNADFFFLRRVYEHSFHCV